MGQEGRPSGCGLYNAGESIPAALDNSFIFGGAGGSGGRGMFGLLRSLRILIVRV